MSGIFKNFVRRNSETFRSELFVRRYNQRRSTKDFSIRKSRIKVVGSGAQGEPASFVLHSNAAWYFPCDLKVEQPN